LLGKKKSLTSNQESATSFSDQFRPQDALGFGFEPGPVINPNSRYPQNPFSPAEERNSFPLEGRDLAIDE
jgi:hypothetical protein